MLNIYFIYGASYNLLMKLHFCILKQYRKLFQENRMVLLHIKCR